MATPHSPSIFQNMTGVPVNPLWVLRSFALAAITLLVLSMFVFKTGGRHDFCLGAAVGILIGQLAQLFATKSVEVNDDPQRSDVENVFVTR